MVNILFSVSLRLLIIDLRRKILVGITTVDELLNGQYQYITVSTMFPLSGLDFTDPFRLYRSFLISLLFLLQAHEDSLRNLTAP
jgi:hypothetical protein